MQPFIISQGRPVRVPAYRKPYVIYEVRDRKTKKNLGCIWNAGNHRNPMWRTSKGGLNDHYLFRHEAALELWLEDKGKGTEG